MKISENHTYVDTSGRRVFVVKREKLTNQRGEQDKFWTYIGYQVDRAGNRIGEPRGWKSDGRDWTGDMHGNILREADIGMSITEPQAVILERLIEAVDTDGALPVATGPKMFGNGWPDSVHSEEEITELEREERRDWKTHQTRQRHQAVDAYTERRAKCSRSRIGRMEEAFSWLGLLFDEEARKILLAYAEVKAKGWDWTRYIETRNRRNQQKEAWVKRTIFRKIAKTLQEVETKLRKREIILRDCAGLHVAHEEAKHSCKSITSDLPVRREDDSNRLEPMLNPANAA
jgi:hypothetical protein